MAATNLRIAQRRRSGALIAAATPERIPTALVAASAPVVNTEQLFKSSVGGGRRGNWQQECWDMYRTVGELRYYVSWRANSCSRVRLVASEIGPDGVPTGSIAEDNAEGQVFADLVRQIADGPLGQSQLIKRIAENLTVPGEIWIMLLIRPEGLKWFAVTNKQIEQGTRRNTAIIKLPDGTKHTFDPVAGDSSFRVWNSDAEDPSQPDSPVRANLDSLREIVRTTTKIRNADDSRINNNGLLVIPQGASLPDPQAPVSADKPGEESPTSGPQRVAPKLQHLLVAQMDAGSKDSRGGASLTPLVIAVPDEHVDKIKHVTFNKDIGSDSIKTRDNAIGRFAMGIDMSVERLLGMGANSNHWSSHQIGDEDVQLHIAPVMETVCQAFYDSVFRNVLAGKGIKPGKYMLWYDTSQLTVDPDKTDEAKDARDRKAITNEAYRRLMGLGDDDGYDLTTLEGAQEWARDAVIEDPALLRDLLPLLAPEVQALDFPQPLPALPPGEDPTDDETDPANGDEPDTEDDADNGKQSAAALTGVELAVVELLIGRVLELAGSRRRTRTSMERLREVPSHLIHRYLDPVDDSEVTRLVSGWDKALDEAALKRMGLSPDRVRAHVNRMAREQLTAAVIDGQVL